FETFGILCSHALKVLDVMNIIIIPDMYITKRWTQHAKEGSMQTTKSYVNLEKAECGPIDRYKELCSEAVKLSSFASVFQKGYVIMKKVMGEAHKQLVEARKKHYSIVGGSFDTLDNPRVALREIGDSQLQIFLQR
ncbi:hypothetical protein CFOL_v3_26337, partial [Cephalotus follicularis]